MKNIPNFLIVGTAKAATTTLHEYLKQHPDIMMSEPKEPCFFTFKNEKNIQFTTGRKVKFITNIRDYQKLFSGKEIIKGESSTPYLYFYDKTIKNIKETIPNYQDVKILIVLRNPSQRAYSQYMMKKRDLVEKLNFEEALWAEKERMKKNAHFDFFYVDRGLYYNQVKAYLNSFNNVKIILYEEVKNDIDSVLHEITNFLGVKNFDFKNISKQNVSGISKYPIITQIIKNPSLIKRNIGKLLPENLKKGMLNKLQRYNTMKGPEMDEINMNKLKALYKEDIQNLEILINRDLSHWYE